MSVEPGEVAETEGAAAAWGPVVGYVDRVVRSGRELSIIGWGVGGPLGRPLAELRARWGEVDLPVAAVRRIARPDVAAAGLARPGEAPGFELRLSLPDSHQGVKSPGLEALQVCGVIDGRAWPLAVPDYVRLEHAGSARAPARAEPEADADGRDRHLVRWLRVLQVSGIRPGSALDRARTAAEAWAERRLERARERRVARPPTAAASSALDRLLDLPDDYLAWRVRTEAALDRRAAADAPATGPLISLVLPVYKVTPAILRATLDSLHAQTYRRWEACIAFADPDGADTTALLRRYARRDPRFKLRVLERNLGIAGNSDAALAMARGDYIGLVDHDDVLRPPALARIITAIAAEPEADFLYTDKELLSESGTRRFSPLFKPAWSPETLYSVNYLTHFNVIRADLMAAIGGWSEGVDGAQDWDLFLRAGERARRVVRVPGVAYSWRVHGGSTSSGLDAKPYALDAQLQALRRHGERIGLPGRFHPHEETGFAIRWGDVPPCRVVVLGAAEVEPLLTLLEHLERERDDFSQVDLLLTPRDRWSLLSAWRARHDGWPAWCRAHRIAGHDPVAACARLLAEAEEAVTVVLDGGLLGCSPGALRQLAGWLYEGGSIAFASGLTVEDEERVIEAGCVIDEAGVAHPLFRDAPLREWGMMGGPLWTRNVDTASPYLLAFRTREAAAALAAPTGKDGSRSDWRGAFHQACVELAAARPQGRGVVDPSARGIIAPGLAFDAPAQGLVGGSDRYLHPWLTLAPGRGLVFDPRRADAA